MSEQTNIQPPSPNPSGGFLTEPPKGRSFPTVPVILAAIAVLIVVAVLVVVGRHGTTPAPTTVQPAAAYASSLAISDLEASESESLSGVKSIYVDGHIVNRGPKTVTGITVQAFFEGDAGQPPQAETAQLAVIRTRQPYVDTEPLRMAPLAPADQVAFRLIFEGVSPDWNEQTPEVRIIRVETK